MNKTIIILPLDINTNKRELKTLKQILISSTGELVFSIPAHINHPLYNDIQKLQIKYIGRIIILPLYKEINTIQMSIHAHKSLLKETDVHYFANYTFKDLKNINIMYNNIDTINNNPQLKVVFCEKETTRKKSSYKKVIHKILNINIFDFNICKRVISKDIAEYIYEDCNLKNKYYFKIYFIKKLYILLGKENLPLSIY
ncbi:hypothetical protein [Wenyingzhuangia marina]|uniref:Uncharacterized protein n=1 Tax=Wenyingzhuangia marina TaxID=1195760 RepID=A0A1M5WMT0_9FLAO|nr:hypothetical protein [Wenyingzhuangia marina]GGF79406.1 hypothetical protein GCM10011397_23090 [Wenyingzhuangia marina]SHH88880.1 hypothetical protein SAMN05444281_2517 [Wenyingzhuangia marina]